MVNKSQEEAYRVEPHWESDLEATGAFVEAPVWQTVAAGWQPLFGSFRDAGFSFEWHDFQLHEEFNWARSFHPGSIELCINLAGTATIHDGTRCLRLQPYTLAFYHSGRPSIMASRSAGERHQFVTVEYSSQFLSSFFEGQPGDLHPLVRGVMLAQEQRSQVVMISPAGLGLIHLTESLQHPPVSASAKRVWFGAKAAELATLYFFQPMDAEMFCTRTRRVGRERVEKAKVILHNELQNPPNLEDLARRVGCSDCYLSRLFSQEVGLTIQQYLRQIRLERAAELLRTGRCNVTEAAYAVGYNSLSHFSTAFHSVFGCRPSRSMLR
ncbi:MAG: helix-turn-helix transcriptional regulator [Verrucomicrobiae bacterium]|nr:helix-turn-helix transcriptional regulator [Verrucomicrobiae bacterium]